MRERCAPSRSGSRDDELAAHARAVAARLDRAAVQLDDALRERQPDAEAAARAVDALLGLHEQLEDLVEHRRARCRSRGRRRAAARGRRCDREPQLDAACPAASSSPRSTAGSRRPAAAARGRRAPCSGLGGSVDVELRRCAPSNSGAVASIAASTAARRSSGSSRSSNLPRVMRETSSRSSSSRVMWCAWRSITDWQRSRDLGAPARARSSRVAFSTAASGLRSSCDSIARNCSRRRAASAVWSSSAAICSGAPRARAAPRASATMSRADRRDADELAVAVEDRRERDRHVDRRAVLAHGASTCRCSTFSPRAICREALRRARRSPLGRHQHARRCGRSPRSAV